MSKQIHEAEFRADNKDFKKKVDEVAQKGNWLSGKVKALGGVLAGAFAFHNILRGFKQIIKNTAEFEKSIASLSAITGATGKDLKFYAEQAKEIGKSTTYGASEAAKAFELMGSARPELLKNKEALADVTKQAMVLAEASGLDLTTATLSLAKAMNQFNVPASKAAETVNILAAGSKEGAAAVPEVAEAIKWMGTSASMANISLEQSVGLVETLAEKGLSGAESGTQLRNVILKLQSEADRFNPAVVGLNTALDNLAAANMSAADLTLMFGLRNQQAAAILIKNRESVKKYTERVTGTNTAFEQQEKNLDTLDSKWKIFTGTLKTATIQSDEFNESAKSVLDNLTEMIKKSKGIEYQKNAWGKLIPVIKEYVYWNEELGEWIDVNTILIKEDSGIKEENKEITEESKDTIADYRNRIEELKDSLESLAVGEGKQAEAIQNQIKQYEALIDSVLRYKTIIEAPIITSDFPDFPDFPDLIVDTGDIEKDLLKAEKIIDAMIGSIKLEMTSLEEAFVDFGSEFLAMGIGFDFDYKDEIGSLNSELDKLLERQSELAASGKQLNASDQARIESIKEEIKAYQSGKAALKDFARAAVDVAERVIAAYIAEAVAGAVKSALVNVPFPFNIAAAGIAGGLAAAAINAAIPEFASGGAVTGPMMALVGEAPGISTSNPEYIGTARQLEQMDIGGSGNKILTARVSRGDLLFILNEGKASNTNNY